MATYSTASAGKTPAVVSATRATRPTRRRGSGHRTSRVAGYGFIGPAAILFIGLVLIPIGYSVYLSTRALRVSGGGRKIGGAAQVRRSEVSVGLGNYRDAFHDSELVHSLLRMLLIGLIIVPIMLALATLFALLLDAPRTRFANFSRLAIFLPYAVPGVIASLLWGFMYLPSMSPFRYAAGSVGLPKPNFFGPTAIWGSVANIAVWGGVGFNMVVLYTSLRAIPNELFDAARIDGCNEFQVARRVKLPLMRPALVMTTVFSVIATLQIFNEPFTLRPLTNVLPTTWMPLMSIYTTAFVKNDIYAAAATSVVLAAGTLLVSLIALRLVQSRALGDS
ncbi:MAG: sugar ABC transporter permease [Actinomycetota bacterium]